MTRDSKTLGKISSGSGSEHAPEVTTAHLRKMRQARGLGATEIARLVASAGRLSMRSSQAITFQTPLSRFNWPAF